MPLKSGDKSLRSFFCLRSTAASLPSSKATRSPFTMRNSLRFLFCTLAPACVLPLCQAQPQSREIVAPALAGHWRIDLTRSTELSPWKGFDLIIAAQGSSLTVERKLSWGRREFVDRIALDLTQREHVLPIDWWADNRHLGAYIGTDHTRRVRAEWLDGQRVLRLTTDLVLDAQQGPRAVNILTDFKVSASGSQLTLTELRSTRNRPVVYVFTRVPAPVSTP